MHGQYFTRRMSPQVLVAQQLQLRIRDIALERPPRLRNNNPPSVTRKRASACTSTPHKKRTVRDRVVRVVNTQAHA
jgi:hypothetical protein